MSPAYVALHLFALVYCDTPTVGRLIKAVVVHIMFNATGAFPPDPNTEGVRRAVAGPDLELVERVVGSRPTVNRARALVAGIVASGYDQLFVSIRVEVEVAGRKVELRVPGWDVCPLLVVGDEAEACLTCAPPQTAKFVASRSQG